MGGGTGRTGGGGTVTKSEYSSPEAEIAALREEIRNLAVGYAASEQRAARAEEMAEWAEKQERIAQEEARVDREFAQGRRAEVFAQERVAEYRQRAQTAEKELAERGWEYSCNNNEALIRQALLRWNLLQPNGAVDGGYLPTGALIDICKAVHGLASDES